MQPGLSLWPFGRLPLTGTARYSAQVSSLPDAARDVQMDASLLAAIVDSSDGAVVSTAPDGTILSWNQAAERIYGWPAEEAMGRHIGLIVPPDLIAEHEEHVAIVMSGGVVRRVETERVTRGGERIPVAFTMSPVLGSDGGIIATAAITRDMSEQRWMAE